MVCCGGRKLPGQGRRLGEKRARQWTPSQYSPQPGPTMPSALRQRPVHAGIRLTRPGQGPRELLRRPPQPPGQTVKAEHPATASVPRSGTVSATARTDQKGREQKGFDSPG